MKKPTVDSGLLAKLSECNGTEKEQNTPEPKPAKNGLALSKRDQKKDQDLDRKLKEKYANAVLAITWIWLSLVIGILITTGITNLYCEKQYLSDAVLIALLSSTSLVGLATIVLHYLFPRR